jgi:hypothetical protein
LEKNKEELIEGEERQRNKLRKEKDFHNPIKPITTTFSA